MTTIASTHRNRKGVPSSLLGKEVVLQNGRPLPRSSFARAPKPAEALGAGPAGSRVEEHPRTGLPLVKQECLTSGPALGSPTDAAPERALPVREPLAPARR